MVPPIESIRIHASRGPEGTLETQRERQLEAVRSLRRFLASREGAGAAGSSRRPPSDLAWGRGFLPDTPAGRTATDVEK